MLNIELPPMCVVGIWALKLTILYFRGRARVRGARGKEDGDLIDVHNLNDRPHISKKLLIHSAYIVSVHLFIDMSYACRFRIVITSTHGRPEARTSNLSLSNESHPVHNSN